MLLIGWPFAVNAAPNFENPIINSVEMGNVQLVHSLLSAGGNINSVGQFGATALMRATYLGDKEMVLYLLRHGANPNMQDVGGATALHIAAREGNADIVALLLQYGARPEIADSEGYTPAMRAVLLQKPSALDVLLKNMDDIKQQNNGGDSVITLAADSKNTKIRNIVIAYLPQSLKKKAIVSTEPIEPKAALRPQASDIEMKLKNSVESEPQPSKRTGILKKVPGIKKILSKIFGQEHSTTSSPYTTLDMSFDIHVRQKSSNIIVKSDSKADKPSTKVDRHRKKTPQMIFKNNTK